MRWSGLLWVALALSACHVSVELDPSRGDASSEPSSCVAIGARCTSDGLCCSGRCGADGLCASAACRQVGSACGAASECCTGACNGGICASASGCSPRGESCTTGTACCSHVCADDGRGSDVCLALGGCLVSGEICRLDAECCGGTCADRDVTTQIGRCAPVSACAPLGDVCRVAGDGTAMRTCCAGAAGDAVPCRPTGAGVDRCIDHNPSACFAPGTACHVPDDCCSGVCVAESDGVLTCRSSCRAGGQSCTRASDCCTGDCAAGVCLGSRTCEGLGASCHADSQCCTGDCAPSMTCESNLI
jgi:hypothetical protein